MKKSVIFILLTLILPVKVIATEFGVTCTESEMLAMQSELDDVKLDIEFLPDNTIVENPYGKIDISNTFMVSAKNLPDDYRIMLYPNVKHTEAYLVTNELFSNVREGGVYLLDFYNTKCGQGVIKSYEIMFPYFNKTNTNNIWSDGTSSFSPIINNETNNSSNLEIKLVIALAILVLIVIITVLLLVKKRKKVNLNVILFILISLSICLVDNVFATSYIIDNGGNPLNPSLGGNSGSSQGKWIMTGVGFKVSLVNVETMESVSDFIVLKDSKTAVPNGLGLTTWYKTAQQKVANNNYGVLGKIGPSYLINKTIYYDCSNSNSISNCCIVDDDSWFLAAAGYNTPNVKQAGIVEKLFGPNQNSPTDTFYEYLARLLYNHPITSLSEVKTTSDAKNLLESTSFIEDRTTLQSYRMIVEPLYIAGNIVPTGYVNEVELPNGGIITFPELGINDYYLYTLKAAAKDTSVTNVKPNTKYYTDFLNNFIASQTHGLINNPVRNDDISDSKSGVGYIIFGIVDKEETKKCNPNGENNCCYSRNGTYQPNYSGLATSLSYYCPDGYIDKDNNCQTTVRTCIPDCEDTLETAECDDGDGTKAVFHENDNLKKCTLNSEKQSGFTLVSANETTPNSKGVAYCEVACKDDFDFELPMKKYAYAGTHFVLDEYTPKLNIKRTCVTSKVDYSTFKNDFDTSRDAMIKAYNDWQDALEYYNYTLTIQIGESASGSDAACVYCAKTCNVKTDKDCETGCAEPYLGTCSYSYGLWSHSAYTATNGTVFSEKKGAEGNSSENCCPAYDSSASRAYLQSSAKKDAETKYNTYVSAKSIYNDIVSKYQKCSSWITEKVFSTDPQVKFVYDDEDKTVFKNKNLTHESTLENDLETKLQYWEENSITNDTYTIGGDDSEDSVYLTHVVCEGTTCTESTGTQRKFITSAYVKREESIEYIYHLPTLYSAIPSGKVYVSDKNLKAYVTLDENSVPINIKTEKGTYDYIIEMSNIVDKTRKNAKNKDIDNFEERFTDSQVLSGKGDDGTKYVCDYKIETDLYEDGKLLYFYRPVEITDINPLGRKLGYNWTDKRANKVKEKMKETGNDYKKLTNGTSEKFEFVLTPSIMQAIRKYNSKKDYGNTNLTCSDTKKDDYYCKSSFLSCLASLSMVETPSEMCNNILYEGSRRPWTSPTSYGSYELSQNRKILINKLKRLPT